MIFLTVWQNFLTWTDASQSSLSIHGLPSLNRETTTTTTPTTTTILLNFFFFFLESGTYRWDCKLWIVISCVLLLVSCISISTKYWFFFSSFHWIECVCVSCAEHSTVQKEKTKKRTLNMRTCNVNHKPICEKKVNERFMFTVWNYFIEKSN